MPIRNADLSDAGRPSRFMPGWWILPGLTLSAAAWAAAIWFLATR